MDYSIDWTVKRSIKNLKENSIEIDSVTLCASDEIANLLQKAKPSKAPGQDNIPNILLKNLPQKAIDELATIFNQCLSKGYFPECFKLEKVIPIPKLKKNLGRTIKLQTN